LGTVANGIGAKLVSSRVRTRRLTISLWQVSENSPPNRTYTSRCIRLSRCQSNFPACNLSWQSMQSAIVLRLRPIMAISHCFLPLKSLSFRIWCISSGTFSAPHHSHLFAFQIVQVQQASAPDRLPNLFVSILFVVFNLEGIVGEQSFYPLIMGNIK